MHLSLLPGRRRISNLIVAVVTVLTACLLSVVISTPQSASALGIDCGYSGSGMRVWIESGGAPGITCLGSHPTGGTGPGSGGTSPGGGGTSGGGTADCTPSMRNLPSWFMDEVNRADSSTWSVQDISGNSIGSRRNWVDNRVHSAMSVIIFRGANAGYILVYSVWGSGMEYSAAYSSRQRCGSAMSFEARPARVESVSGVPTTQLVGPGLPMTPEAGQLETRGALTAVPGSTDRYFLRVDVTNPASETDPMPAFIDLGFGFAFDFESVAALPPGATCGLSDRAIQSCTVQAIPAGQTRTLTFVTKVKAGVAADAPLLISVSNAGVTEVTLDEPVHPTRRMLAPVMNSYTAIRPMPVTSPVVPTTPTCTGAETGGGSVTPAPAQPVVAGLRTKLDSLCSVAAHTVLSTVAGHGTVSADAYGWVRYTPDAAYRGADTITVVATDTSTGLVSAPTTISVVVCDTPRAVDDTFIAARGGGTPLGASVLTNDEIPAGLAWTVQLGSTPPAHGTLDLDPGTGALQYTPEPGYIGADTVHYRLVGPDDGASAPATITFTVG